MDSGGYKKQDFVLVGGRAPMLSNSCHSETEKRKKTSCDDYDKQSSFRRGEVILAPSLGDSDYLSQGAP